MRIRFIPAALAALAVLPPSARAGVEWGGSFPPGRAQHLRAMGGAVVAFEGMVAETTRKVYDVTGQTWMQDDAESFDTSDFDLDGTYGLFGLSCDAMWSFLGLQLDTAFFQPSTRSTARRDYYIAVGDDVDYQGRSYDHLMIPKGTTFDADLTGNLTELTLRLVPVGFKAGESLRINPSLELGLLFFGGQYDIDAGEPTGVVQYQNPPEDFVVGGHSGGYAGLVAPQWGPGLEVHFGGEDRLGLDVQVHYLFCDYDGSTTFFTSSDHREKNLEFTHRNLRVRGQIEIPLERVALNVGVQLQWIDTDGLVSSKSTDPEEILERRERFDKEFSFQLDSVLATIGLTF